MEQLQNGFTLDIPAGCFPLSTDSILLSDFVHIPKNARILDLGSGCGTLGLLLCARDSGCAVTGVEIDGGAHDAALTNIARNGLQHRMTSLHGDLRQAQGKVFDLCISNPPYYSGGPASLTTPTARRDDHCSMEELFAAAGRHTKYGGDFCLVHKPENLARLCYLAVQNGLEPKRLRLVHHKEGGPVSLVLLACRKGGKPGLMTDEVTLFHRDGTPTGYYRSVYHL